MSPNSKSGLSRRTMLATTGGVVAAGMVSSPTYALNGGKDKYEISNWERRVGQTFRCNPARHNGEMGTSGVTLTLTDVIRHDTEGQERPDEFRDPFSLCFQKKSTTQERFKSSMYEISTKGMKSSVVSLTEVMNMANGKMMVEAVFN